ncbi:flagellar hook-associated family protein [Agrobacterium vitis]|uniref:flagellar hook-associated family protein n=1 Tax=Agrobacterium vitis TaxID=373 RepID=UPI0020364F0A|nr:flagellar hook-associated family protein [Agrobacterium vitis]MCM2452725.1 flagellar hook-associated family protein [Agrobacterium vitis]
MKTSSISSLTIQNAMRLTISDAQKQMSDAQTEVTTGKYADVGTELGAKTSSAVDLNRDSLRLQSLMDTNSIVSTRLDASQTALDTIASAATTMQSTLVGLGTSTDSTTLDSAQKTMKSAMDSFIDAANTSVNGEYLFSGINTDVKPITDYYYIDDDGNETDAKQNFDNLFSGYFGMSPDDDGVSGISADQMDDFMENVLEPSFDGADWTDNWSAATDETMTSRISKNEVIQSSSSANSDGFRYTGLDSVIGSEMLNGNYSTETRNAMISKAIEYSGLAVSGINDERTQLGLSQERVTNANDSLTSQKDIIENQLSNLTGVDAYEASTRLNNLQSLVETSYTLTARLQKLSLVDYL